MREMGNTWEVKRGRGNKGGETGEVKRGRSKDS